MASSKHWFTTSLLPEGEVPESEAWRRRGSVVATDGVRRVAERSLSSFTTKIKTAGDKSSKYQRADSATKSMGGQSRVIQYITHHEAAEAEKGECLQSCRPTRPLSLALALLQSESWGCKCLLSIAKCMIDAANL